MGLALRERSGDGDSFARTACRTRRSAIGEPGPPTVTCKRCLAILAKNDAAARPTRRDRRQADDHERAGAGGRDGSGGVGHDPRERGRSMKGKNMEIKFKDGRILSPLTATLPGLFPGRRTKKQCDHVREPSVRYFGTNGVERYEYCNKCHTEQNHQTGRI